MKEGRRNGKGEDVHVFVGFAHCEGVLGVGGLAGWLVVTCLFCLFVYWWFGLRGVLFLSCSGIG